MKNFSDCKKRSCIIGIKEMSKKEIIEILDIAKKLNDLPEKKRIKIMNNKLRK